MRRWRRFSDIFWRNEKMRVEIILKFFSVFSAAWSTFIVIAKGDVDMAILFLIWAIFLWMMSREVGEVERDL